MLDKFQIKDQVLWNKTGGRILFQLHKYKSHQLAQILDVFARNNVATGNLLDDIWGEQKRASAMFFERIVSILPLHIPNFKPEEIVRTLEILVEKNLGSERLFEQYLLLNIEKNVLKFTPAQFSRTVRTLADKRYYEDPVFWQQYMFKYVNHDRRGVEDARRMSP
jgi:hypothetical protein